jgi:hypothetical protein
MTINELYQQLNQWENAAAYWEKIDPGYAETCADKCRQLRREIGAREAALRDKAANRRKTIIDGVLRKLAD